MRNLTVNLSSWEETDYSSLRRGLSFLPRTTLSSFIGSSNYSSTLTELWLQNPDAIFLPETYNKFSNLSKVPLPTLSRNFEVLLNTYWQSTYGAKYLFGNLSADLNVYNNIESGRGPAIDFNTSQTIITNAIGEQYVCNMVFATTLIIISGFLFLVGAASSILMSMTLAPDILGYMSSYTRDNPFTALNQASHLDGLERTKAMKEMRIILGDVSVGCEIGHIAFAVTANTQRLQKDKMYD